MRSVFALLGPLLVGAPLSAAPVSAEAAESQAEDVRIEVRVTSAAGASIYLDRGRADGIAVGDRVTFTLESNTAATALVRSVSENGARAEVEPGSPEPPVGARGAVLVPRDRFPGGVPASGGAAAGLGAQTAEHPPWTHPPEEWTQDKPLLAPAFGLAPEERERRVRGRAWLRFNGTRDAQNDRDDLLAALGTDLTVENPFGAGGALRFDAEAFTRQSDVSDGVYSYDDSRLRLDRLFYEVGGTKDRPNRYALGRFVQREFSELGLLDGAEWTRRTEGGSRFGASVGYMPEPYADLTSFQDLQASLYYRHAFDASERTTLGAVYQNSWHEGEQDRNLFLFQLQTRPSKTLAVRATAWVDLYTSDDMIKGSGAELTEGQVSATWSSPAGTGLGLFVAHRVYPEMLRDEYVGLSPELLRDGKLDRVAANAWTMLGQRTRLSGRVELWSDQDDDGTTGEVGLSRRDLLGAASDVGVTAQYADGSYSSGPGLRLSASKTFGTTTAALGWQSFWFDQKDYGGSESSIAQHSLYGTLDLDLWEGWTLSLVGDHTFGDQTDSWMAGVLLQTRF